VPCDNILYHLRSNQVSNSPKYKDIYIFRCLWLGPTHDNEMLMCVIDLIYIHRSWFAEALRDSEDPLQHEYGQSVISIYRSANILINGMRSLCAAHPKEAGRVWFFWSCFYTSSVRMYDLYRECLAHRRIPIKILLGAIVVKCPGCKLARPALTLLEESFTVYEQGSRLCRPPATVV
jgi:hypothetical protein